MGKFILTFKRKGAVTPDQPSGSDLVELGILPKQISEFTNSDIGTTVLIPYTDPTGKILLNNGNIEFEVVGVDHHKDTTNVDTPTITLMTKNIIRYAAFDAKEPLDVSTDGGRRQYGNNRWKYSNIRQWLNSSKTTNWFTKQHDYDEAPTADNVGYNSAGAYADDPGFLAGFSPEVFQHFTDITNTTMLCELDRVGSETSETTVDKVFLPSYTEMGYGEKDGVAEGNWLSTRYPDKPSRKKEGARKWYWMRTPTSVSIGMAMFVGSDGFDNTGNVFVGDIGISPIIVLH